MLTKELLNKIAVQADIERKNLIGILVSEEDLGDVKKWTFTGDPQWNAEVKSLDSIWDIKITQRENYNGGPLFILSTGEIVDETYLDNKENKVAKSI